MTSIFLVLRYICQFFFLIFRGLPIYCPRNQSKTQEFGYPGSFFYPEFLYTLLADEDLFFVLIFHLNKNYA